MCLFKKNLPNKIKDGAYVINLDEHKDTGTHWVALFCKKNEIVYFDSYMLVDKTLIDYTNLFSPYDFNKNDSIILSYFKDA